MNGPDAQSVKRTAAHKARRWVAERTHSWMNRVRGILNRWNKTANSPGLLHLVRVVITRRSAGFFGRL